MRKIVRSICILLIIFIVVFIILFVKKLDNNYNTDEVMETTKKIREFEEHYELAYWVAIKNGDWSDLPLTDVFRKKYNEKDGIFGKMQFDKVEYRPYHDGKYPFEDFAYLVITQGKKKTAYTYSLDPDSGDGYNDVIIGDVYPLTDEKGNELDFRVGITEKNFLSKMYGLAWGNEEEQLVGVTDAFHRKYPYFLDLFIHYSPLSFNKIRFDGGNFDDKVAYFEVDSIFECVKRKYEVKFELDDKGYLDDAETTCISMEKYEIDSLTYPYDTVLYKNSNWNNLKITNKFKNKYNPENGCFYDIDRINVNIEPKSVSVDGLYTEIRNYVYKDGSNKWFCVKFINDTNGYLDDIEFIPIDYTGTDAEKAKEMYLKSVNK